jgi:hypothetical protein
MSTVILVVVALVTGVYIGFLIGFSRAMRGAAGKFYGTKRPVVGWLFGVLGSIGLLVAIGSWFYLLHFTHVALHATGTVIEMQQQVDKDGVIAYAPTFSFVDVAGVQYTVSSGFFQSPPAFHIGDTVPILYLSSDPRAARIDSYWQVWGLPSLLAILGGFFLAVGLIVILWPRIIGRLRRQIAHQHAA